jgi:glycosyltransferase involved in cell wall biosynthesis
MADERPRVLFLGPDVPGGMSTAMNALLASPLADRYRIEVLPTYRGNGAARRLLVFAAALPRLLVWSLRGRGRIVHVHSTVRGSMYRKAICVLLAKALRRRVILQMHSGPGDIISFEAGLNPVGAGLVRLAFRAADTVLAVSSASAAALGDAFGAAEIQVIPNAAPRGPEGLASPGRDRDPLAIYLGGFANPVKGGDVLLAALERPDSQLPRFVLAGPGELPDSGRRLLERQPGIEWRGWLEPAEKDQLLRSAEVFVLPSTSEGLPMALLEAMAYGLAIVATNVGGVPDVADDEVDALVVPSADPAALAAAVARLAADPGLRQRLGDGARAQSLRLAPERIAEQFDTVYRRLLGTPGEVLL